MAIRKSSNSGIPFGNTAGRPSSPGTGQPYFNGELQRLELYTGAIYGWQNIVAETPGVTGYTGSVLETNATNTITITGTNFSSGATATLVGTDGTEYTATTTTVNNLTQITAVFGSIPQNKEPYDIRVTNPSNLYGVYYDILTVNDKPVWTTAAGSLGSFNEGSSISITLAATDEENNSITYSIASGSSLPAWLSLNSSTGIITGTAPSVSSDTTYSFTINASDGINTPTSRAFSIVINSILTWNTSSGSLGTVIPDVNNSFSYQLSATGIGNTLTYSLLSGSLPSGLTINSSGLISGTVQSPASLTTDNFVIRVSDGDKTLDRSFSISRDVAQSSAFSFTGGWQSFTVPSGKTSVKAIVWGAGGGGAFNSWVYGWGGGSGGFASAVFNVSPGQTLYIACGEGGRPSQSFSGGGGGMSGVFSSNTFTRQNAVVIAGGGGGGGNSRINSVNLSGGAGGGTSGNSGGSQTSTGATAPTGGNQSSVGSAGLKGYGSGTNGSAGDSMRGGLPGEYTSGGYTYLFGEGPNPTNNRFLGGGGGAGYYGGGGGCYEEPENMQGGGGGSGFVGGNSTFSIVSGTTSLIAGNNGNSSGNSGSTVNPPQTSSPYYSSTVGIGAGGGGNGQQGGHGRVVLIY